MEILSICGGNLEYLIKVGMEWFSNETMKRDGILNLRYHFGYTQSSDKVSSFISLFLARLVLLLLTFLSDTTSDETKAKKRNENEKICRTKKLKQFCLLNFSTALNAFVVKNFLSLTFEQKKLLN